MIRLVLNLASWLAVAAVIVIAVAQRRPPPRSWLPDEDGAPGLRPVPVLRRRRTTPERR
jgi:hypothetical protein